MNNIYSTNENKPNQQFDFWCDEICRKFVELTHDRTERGNFSGEILQQPLTQISVSKLTADAHAISRTSLDISHATEESYFVNLQLKGTGRIRQSGQEIIAKPGDLVLVDTRKPYEISHNEPFGVISVKIPYELLKFQLELQHLHSTAYVPAENGYAGILRSYTISLLNEFNTDVVSSTSLLEENLVNLIAIALNTSDALAGSSKLASQRYSRLQAISGYINCHLSDPMLDIQRVASHFSLSPRYIQKLFAATGTTFSQVLLRRRLNKCAAYLRAPEYGQKKLTEIAFTWGFNDFSYFSRAFKKMFGASPSGYKKAHMTNY